jgi:hypothetical protein
VTAAVVVSVMMMRTDREPRPAAAPATVVEPLPAPVATPADAAEVADQAPVPVEVAKGGAAPATGSAAPAKKPKSTKAKPCDAFSSPHGCPKPTTPTTSTKRDAPAAERTVDDDINEGLEAAKQGAEELRKAGEDLRKLRDGLKGTGSN